MLRMQFNCRCVLHAAVALLCVAPVCSSNLETEQESDPHVGFFHLHASVIGTPGEAEACGACHPEETERYALSRHARGVIRGVVFAPTCTSCHGVESTDGNKSLTIRSYVNGVSICTGCHQDPRVLAASDLPLAVVDSYEASYHGIAHLNGINDVATCSSCHESHQTLPPDDERSWVHPARVDQTCTECHDSIDQAMIEAVRHPAGGPGVHGFLSRFRIYFPVAGRSISPLIVSGLGAFVGFLSGIFGVGGGFLMTPLLIFAGIPAAVAAATDSAQITAGASSGAFFHSRLGHVDFKMATFMVIGGWVGGALGVFAVYLLRSQGDFDLVLRLLYVLILGFVGFSMLVEGIRTLRGRVTTSQPPSGRLARFLSALPMQTDFPRSRLRTSIFLPLSSGLLVGLLAAFLGVGGGFLMLPTMIYIIGIPTRIALGTDLVQIVLVCANVTLLHSLVNQTVDVLLALTLFAGVVVGARIGAAASRYFKGEPIRVALAVLLIVITFALGYHLVAEPSQLVSFAMIGGSR